MGVLLTAFLSALMYGLVQLVFRGFTWWAVYKVASFDLWWTLFLTAFPAATKLALPEWNEAVEPLVAAANAWVPIAELFILFKLYWTGQLALIPFRIFLALKARS